MFESLTPTFQTLHPIGVVNHLHSQSLDRVESKNTLMKKEKSLDLQEKLLETIKEPIKEKHHKKKSEAESEMLRTFEKSVSSFVQASLHLPRINFLCLQASVVEEMCAFSGICFSSKYSVFIFQRGNYFGFFLSNYVNIYFCEHLEFLPFFQLIS